MKKTRLMLEVEEQIEEKLETYMRRSYQKVRMSSPEIAEELGVSDSAVCAWIKKAGIPLRTISESQLPVGFKKPTGRQLETWYVTQGKSTVQIGKELGKDPRTVNRWLREAGIGIRSAEEARPPKGGKRATKEQLEQWYITERKPAHEIADMLGTCQHTVSRWIRNYGIPPRSASEALLPEGVKKPSKEVLERMYHKEGKNSNQIAEEVGVSGITVRKWMRSYGIARRSISEAKLPEGVTKATKKQLYQWYVRERKTTREIAESLNTNHGTIRRWLRGHNIKIRTSTESRMGKGYRKPTKKQLYRWYVTEDLNARDIGKKLGVHEGTIGYWLRDAGIDIKDPSETRLKPGVRKPTRQQLYDWYVKEKQSGKRIARQLGVCTNTLYKWLRHYGISAVKPIKNKKQLLTFLKEDEPARNLAAAAISLNGQSAEVEHIIIELYEGRFRDQGELHQLLQDNTEEIYALIAQGMTNIAHYIGPYTAENASISPTLVGAAIEVIPDDRITPSLEDRLTRLLRTQYSPLFNHDPEKTLRAVKEKVREAQGKRKNLYSKLHAHYRETMKLQQELGGLQ